MLHLAVSFGQFLHDLLHPLAGPTSAKAGGYLFYSGIAGVSFIGGGIWANFFHRLHRHSCAVRGCWKPAKFPVADGKYMVCCYHHPDVPDRGPTAQQVVDEHEALQRE